jgi:hypothetical protein
MYFRFSLRHNPGKGRGDAYYRLIESYRNEKDRVCHRTLLNVGFLDDLVTAARLNQVRRILCNRREEVSGNPQLSETEKITTLLSMNRQMNFGADLFGKCG